MVRSLKTPAITFASVIDNDQPNPLAGSGGGLASQFLAFAA